MDRIKSLDVILHIDSLIYRQQTGNSYEFAEKIGKSRSCLFVFLGVMRAAGAPIEYCPYKRTYYYKEKGRIIFGFVRE